MTTTRSLSTQTTRWADSRPLGPSRWVICEHCDSVFRRPTLALGETAYCACCDAVLERNSRFSDRTLLALVLTGLIVFIQANLWPVVTLGLNGQHVSARLWSVIIMMWKEHAQVVAVVAALTLFFFPLFKMLSLGWLLLFASQGERAPGFRSLMVLLHYVRPWTMSEVFVLGALVSIVKARLYFDVQPNVGVYAYGALTLLITVFSGVDMRRLWDTTASGDAH